MLEEIFSREERWDLVRAEIPYFCEKCGKRLVLDPYRPVWKKKYDVASGKAIYEGEIACSKAGIFFSGGHTNLKVNLYYRNYPQCLFHLEVWLRGIPSLISLKKKIDAEVG